MFEILSFSVLQVLSVISFLTSILAVLHVGAGSLHRLSNKFEADLNLPQLSLHTGKPHLWNWSGLPASFSLSSILGEESQEQSADEKGLRYMGGSDFSRVHWQVGRSRFGPQFYDSQPPLSMAKVIMSRHVSAFSLV
ncbi:uncharacterized protein C8Q71DRAFT_124231 [Rhodofomes roseus]|uniref:Uncharacterized protein n=1 Tax=Rhodofomes roseus TaxID=34475 RepID=A0ABQ8KBA2_9APHY|nr:uncharacterized protein C8Q71DRAFT_124231 [Rhodofomes roseus]KAH9834783.1 hypothetical protein C8Q71DRAFT_124231 [Rhodofomes roseus]